MQPQKPTPKNFLITFIRIIVVCAIAYVIANGVKYLIGAI